MVPTPAHPANLGPPPAAVKGGVVTWFRPFSLAPFSGMLPRMNEVTRKVAAAFDAAGIRYFLGGSVASALYGEARSTRDVDFVAAILPHHRRLERT